MNRVFFGCLVLGLAVAACAEDPTANLGGTPAYVVTQYAELTMAAGDSVSVTAETRDGQGVALSELPVATSEDGAVAAVSDGYLPPLAQARFFVKGVAAGETLVIVSVPSNAAIQDTIVVTVN